MHMAGARLRPVEPLVGQGPGYRGSWALSWGGCLAAVALKEGLGRGWAGHGQKQGAPAPQAFPEASPTPMPRAASPLALKWLSLPPWLGVRPGQDPADSWPWSRGPALWASGFLGFPGDGGRQGGVFPGQGVGVTPQPISRRVSLLCSEIFVPPTAP